MKKIYFCGSIRGGRDDAQLYFRLIGHMKEEGFRVLTEHIGSPELFGMEATKTDDQIWQEDMSWLSESDLVIAECSTPSLGVGYELAMAKVQNKPTFCFYRSRDRFHGISAMISGDPYYRLFPYADEAELTGLLDEVLDQHK